jgi:hypothetical protein
MDRFSNRTVSRRASGTRLPAILRGIALCVTACLIGSFPAHAAKKEKTPDLIWTHPAYASFHVDRIALLPAATYDANLQAAGIVEQSLGLVLRPTGYRWVGPGMVRDVMRAQDGGDSLLKVVAAALLKDPRPDSLLAPRVCGMLHCDAMLTVRIDQWQQTTLEWNQSGKPSTTVQLHAAMVDAHGALLWTASGSQTTDGPEQDANAGVMGVKAGGLDRTPLTNQGGPPSYREVATSLLTRWGSRFPAKPAPAPAPADSVTVTR